MKSYLQFLTTPTADTPGTSLILHFDKKRYLFGNIAEGTQRASIQESVRLLKVQEVFVTGRSEWSNIGGLLGLMLTLADGAASSAVIAVEDLKKKFAKKRDAEIASGIFDEEQARRDLDQAIRDQRSTMTIYGARNLNYMLATARRFIFRKSMPVDAREINYSLSDNNGAEGQGQVEPTFVDDNVKIWAMAIAPPPSSPSRSTGTISPRKRSFDELMDTPPAEPTTPSRKLDADSLNKVTDLCKNVVHEMFNSTWTMDALVETPIQQVSGPAAMFVRNTETRKLEHYKGPRPGGNEPVPDINVFVRRPWPGALIESLPATEPAKEAVSYIVRNHPQRGKFDVKRAQELGLKDPWKYKFLANGENVVNPQGETITPDMVLKEGKVGGGVAIVDMPSAEYVEPLLRRPEWNNKDIMAGVGAYVWILGPGISDHPALQEFMKQNSNAEHIVSSIDTNVNRLSLDSVAGATARLAQIDPTRFRVPIHDEAPAKDNALKFHIADRGQVLNIEPAISVSADGVTPPFDGDAAVSDLSDGVKRLAAKARDEINEEKVALDAWAEKLPQKDSEVITLGTGSALPSKYRNVSATLVRVPGWGSILLDCGENTLGQLKRVFPPDELKQIFQELRMIWISHMHADHHLGLVSVVKAWYQTVHKSRPASNPPLTSVEFNASKLFANQNRLSVISDRPMLHWLWEYSQMEDYGYSRIAPLYITPAKPDRGRQSQIKWFRDPTAGQDDSLSVFEHKWEQLERMHKVQPSMIKLSDLQSVAVKHCHGAMAVSITLPSGFKVSYSGDCRPCPDFAKIGKDSTVCIHEATFDDELQGDAIAKNHSTTAEALSIASAMCAKSVVLTHFSQRYQKVPVLEYAEADEPTSGPPTLNGAETTAEPSAETSTIGSADDAPLEEPDIEMALDAPDPPDEAYMPDISEPTSIESASSSQRIFPQSSLPPSSSTTTKQKTIRLRASPDMKICVAFDYMRVRVGDIAQMEKFTPALLEMFADEERRKEEEKEANLRRQREVDEEARRKREAKVKAGTKGEGKKKGEDGSRKEVRKMKNFEGKKDAGLLEDGGANEGRAVE